jgi:hypothetical protein
LHAIGLDVTLGVVLTLAFSVLLIPYRPPPARVA